jgi:hypothetical protein
MHQPDASIIEGTQPMSQTPPSSLTCPAGHTFPYEQLTTRGGLAVCPVCDGMRWDSPHRAKLWSRTLLAKPLLLVFGAVVMFLVEMVSGVGIGTTYQNDHVGGAVWLTAGSAVSLLAILFLGFGVIRIIVTLRSESWSRAALSTPLILVAASVALLAVGDLLELGLNIAFLSASGQGAAWQLVAQIFDTLFFASIAGALGWIAVLAKRPDPAATS